MPTSPQTQSGASGNRISLRAPWTLRRRLTLTVAGLLVLASLLIGIVSVLSLRSFLIERLDTQLGATVNRSQNAVDDDSRQNGPNMHDGDDHASGALLAPGQAAGTLVGVISETTVSAGVLARDGSVSLVGTASSDQAKGLSHLREVTPDAAPVTVHIDDLGDYRVVAISGARGEALVIGLPLDEVDAATKQLVLVILTVSILGIGATILAGRWLIRLELRPLDRVAEMATRVSELPLDKGQVDLADRIAEQDADSRTEVGRVGNAVNLMLGHIARALTSRQASEDKVRRFVADASHELRTPLASIRGYAELTRRGGAELPDDVRHSLTRIESEATRMTGLVEDLLLLARLDEGRALERVPVDLSRTIVDAVSDAHAAGPDHEWHVDLPEEPIEVPGDSARLHQVIVNLLANARVHTPAGSRVDVALEKTNGVAVVTVVDNGPGIQEADLPTLFERFTRGDASRTRATGSTGLGLAIVAAVVAAHQGLVTVTSTPGHTEFRVSLPLV
jgi:two-component system OmpR family sensor kinase